KKRRRAS
ncbi:Ribonuclease III (EC 3.1.26.3), partial [Terribacillus sp. AE2B 122]